MPLVAIVGSSAASSSPTIPERIKYENKKYYRSLHLPQHRIRRPERQVPYPSYHPLSRYLRLNDDDEFNADDKNGTRNSRRKAGQTPHRKQRRTEQQSRRRRRRDVDYSNENEFIVEDKVLLDDSGELLHYWTVTGRNLITSSSYSSATDMSGVSGAVANDEISDESAKLLMDVDQLTSKNSSGWSGFEGGDENDMKETIIENALPYIGEQPTTFETATTMDVVASSITETANSTESIYQPIRLRAIFTDDQTSGFQYLTDTQRTILMEQIVNPALFAWSKALSVVPVGGDDIIDEGSKDNGDNDNHDTVQHDSLVVDKTQLYDGETCGPGLVSMFS